MSWFVWLVIVSSLLLCCYCGVRVKGTFKQYISTSKSIHQINRRSLKNATASHRSQDRSHRTVDIESTHFGDIEVNSNSVPENQSLAFSLPRHSNEMYSELNTPLQRAGNTQMRLRGKQSTSCPSEVSGQSTLQSQLLYFDEPQTKRFNDTESIEHINGSSTSSQVPQKQQKRRKKKKRNTKSNVNLSISSSMHHDFQTKADIVSTTGHDHLPYTFIPVVYSKPVRTPIPARLTKNPQMTNQLRDHQAKLESVECQRFRMHFDQILNAITNPDMLAAKLYAKHIISVDTLEKSQSEVLPVKKRTLKLLLAVQKQISVSPTKTFRGFVGVLHSDQSLQYLANRLDPKSDSCLSSQSEISTSSTPGNQQPGTTGLTERHHSVLCEYLNKHAAHWRTIGQYLGFLPGELDIIESKPTLIVGGPVAYLSEMLAKWLQWAPGDSRGSEDLATLEALKYALNKAGFGVTAMETDAIQSHLRFIQSSMGRNKQLVFGLHQSLETAGWVIGKLMKEVRVTPKISLYDEYANYLRDYYTHSRQSDDKWPHFGVREYIRLAVVSNRFKFRKDLNRFREATIHGSIDDIIEAKAPIELHEIVQLQMTSYSYECRDLPITQGGVFARHKYKLCRTTQVLIEGAPGIGKSTLCWEICERWAKGELFTYFSMVLLLKFRDKWVQDAKCLSDLFGVQYRDHKIRYGITREIESTQGRGLLLILEGYDEAPASLQTSKSIYLDLFTGKLLPKATVVITTRPSASSGLLRMCQEYNTRRIEVLGFGTEEIDEYIHGSFSRHIELLPDFQQYLKLYPHIHSMMYVPLNSAIVTRVYQDSKSTSSIVPKTMTQLYSSLIRTLLLRYVREQPEHKNVTIHDFTDLPKPIHEQFLKLCEIAYSGVMKAQTELIFSDLPSDFNTLGLMQSCPELYIDEGESFSYNFLHLTIQEFLAAYHISLFAKDKFENEIVKLAEKPVVVKFLVGLCQTKAIFWKSASKLMPVSSDDIISMPTLHMLFEAHDISAFTVLEHSKLCFHPHITMTPFDCYVLGSCIASSACTCIWEIDFSEFDQINYELLVKGLMARTRHVKPAIVLKHISEYVSNSLLDYFDSNLTLEHLKIVPKKFESKTAFNLLVKLLKHNNSVQSLQLNLDGSKIGISGTFLLADALETNCTIRLEYLDLNDNGIQTDGTVRLAEALKTNSTLKYLKLTHNRVENKGTVCLAKALEVNSTLEHLDLSNNEIQNEGVIHLANALEKNSRTTLKYLGLQFISIDDGACRSIASMLDHNQSLIKLDLSGNFKFTSGGISPLNASMTSNSTLEILYLSTMYRSPDSIRIEYC